MERSLDPDLLRQALGEEGANLPTQSELADLIGQAEIDLLRGRPEVGTELMRVAWYLHGVASSHDALERYGAARQRAAFRVSSHILDLSLQQRRDSPEWADIFRRAFAAQVASIRSELDPNAIAIYWREVRRYERREEAWPLAITLENGLDRVAVLAGMALLGSDVRGIMDLADSISREARSMENTWEIESVDLTMFGASAGVVSAVYGLIIYLVYGNEDRFERAIQELDRVVTSPYTRGNRDARWVAAHLLDLANRMRASSIRSVLPPDTPEPVRRAFTVSPPVLTLWPPQIEFVRGTRGEGGVLSPSTRRAVVSAPTSAGKTLVAQLVVASHCATAGSGVCYVAPTRSLCREVKRDLSQRLRYLAYEVHADLPEWLAPTDGTSPEVVEVMTPERLSHLLRMEGTRILDRFGLFLFDEVHNLKDGRRGWTLESDIAFIHANTLDSQHRVLLLSAAVSNHASFATWLDAVGSKPVITQSEWRGPRQIHAIYTTRKVNERAEPIVRKKAKLKNRMVYPLMGELHVRNPGSGRTMRLTTEESVGKLELREDYSRDVNHTTAAYRTLVPLILHLAKQGQVLVVESTKAGAARLAGAIAEEAPEGWPRDMTLVDAAVEQLGEGHPLTLAVRRGVGYHHGSLPPEIRVRLEDATTGAGLQVLVSTTTLTDGINLPVRSVVVASRGSFGSGTYEAYIEGAKLLNAIGRAGRAAKETEGVVVIATASPNSEAFSLFSPSANELKVQSTLASEKALADLAKLEDRLREVTDALYEEAGTITADFIAFVWFIASELERLDKAVEAGGVDDILENTLAWVQLSDEEKARWKQLAAATVQAYEQTSPGSRRRWSTSGASLGTAQTLESIARELASQIPDEELEPIEALRLILADGRLERLLGLPDAPEGRVWSQKAGRREEVGVPAQTFLMDWISGLELKELADKHLHAVKDPTYRLEQAVDFVSRYFELHLPWVVRTITEWANVIAAERMQQEGFLGFGLQAPQLPDEVASYIRSGVGTKAALELISNGVFSRRLATAVAASWSADEEAQTQSVAEWLGTMGISEWVARFDPSPSELRDLLYVVRVPSDNLAAKMLAGEEIQVQFKADVKAISTQPALLVTDEIEGHAALGVHVGGAVIGAVDSRYQQDLEGFVAGGYPMEATAEVAEGQGQLRCRLIEP